MVMPVTTASVAEPSGQIDDIRRTAGGTPAQILVECRLVQLTAGAASDEVPPEMDVTAFDLQMSALDEKPGDLVPGL